MKTLRFAFDSLIWGDRGPDCRKPLSIAAGFAAGRIATAGGMDTLPAAVLVITVAMALTWYQFRPLAARQ